jgi:Iron-containing redox enzyme
MKRSIIDELYMPHVREARTRMEADPAFCALRDPGIDPILLERYLIAFNASGVAVTEPVDGWIRRAGERCCALGFEQIGRSLIVHSHHEAGHHLMMIKDTHSLVECWNEQHSPKLDAERLLAAPPLPATQDYIKLHEETIVGDRPYGQVAIEFEIERMSTAVFGPIIENWMRVLRPDVMRRLSFINEHVEIDVAHTQLNQKILTRLLEAHPDAGEYLGATGTRALDIYRTFTGEILAVASAALAVEAIEAV